MSRIFVALSLTTVLVLSTIAGCGKSEAEKFNARAEAGLAALAQQQIDRELNAQIDKPVTPGSPIRPYLDEKEQAAAAGVPEVSEASRPVSAIVILHCRQLVGLAFIGGDGSVHNVPLEGITKQIAQDLLSNVTPDKVAGYVVPCGHSDGTPI